MSTREFRELLALERESDPLDQTILASEIDIAIYVHNMTAKKETERGNGKCRKCRRPISEKRLAAVPGALRCVSCQEGWEKENLQ